MKETLIINPPSDDGDHVLDDGRVISPEGEELFTAYFSPTVGRLVLIRTFKKKSLRTRLLSTSSHSTSSEDGNSIYVSRRPAKNRVNILNYNVHNRLTIAGTLTLSEWPDGVIAPLNTYIENLIEIRGGPFPWTAVAEIGALGQPHWHLCLPDEFDHNVLVDQWAPMSITDFQVLATPEEIIKWSQYMGKGFDIPKSERLTHRRFHSGPGFRPKPIKYERVTKAQAMQLVEEEARKAGSTITEWDGPDAWCPKGYFWDI